MAMFRFNRAAGRKINDRAEVEGVGHADHPATKAPHENLIKRAFKNYGLSQLSISHIAVRDTTIAIKATADSAAERDAIILAAGNIAGIDTVQADITVPEGTPDPIFHQVAHGETLAQIAQNAEQDITAKDLHTANNDELQHSKDVYPGQTIRIPKS